MDLVSKIFLTGFAVTGAFGPQVGKLVDRFGRKKGTLAFVLLYILSALSTRSNQLGVVLLGRIAAGLGTSLLFSAPEAWLVSEHERSKVDGKWLGETFGWAYTGDSLVAILAGQLAGLAARRGGPTGPFLLSIGFLLSGAAVALLQWGENTAGLSAKEASAPETVPGSTSGVASPVPPEPPVLSTLNTSGVGDRRDNALQAMLADQKILLLGAVQALFEGAMYIFVLQWPPLMKRAILSSAFGASAAVPYGSIFSCLMASCLVGSTAFSALQKRGVAVEKAAPFMLLSAAAAMISVTQLKTRSLLGLSTAMFLFEACVGMYFPTIGTLRSKYLPDKYRSVIMNFFGIPLNLIVISVVLSSKLLGVDGALAVAAASMLLLRNVSGASEPKPQFQPM
jgi:MFS family permease